MPLPDFSTLVAVDKEHLPELAAAWSTWVKWRPEVMRNPVLFVVDEKGDGVNTWHTQVSEFWRKSISEIVGDNQNIKYCFSQSSLDWPQRERMLTGLIAAVDHVETDWYLKLDTDTIAAGFKQEAAIGNWSISDDAGVVTHSGKCGSLSFGQWWEDEWFAGDAVLIASAWNYTKPYSYLDACDEWADKLIDKLQTSEDCRRLATGAHCMRTVTGNIARHPRIISYAMWGRTDWTRRMWRLCGGRLPCPSQDTTLWYAAVRGGWPIIRANQKKFGWVHCGSSLKRVRERAAIALQGWPRRSHERE